MLQGCRRRSGFTLVELLVVLAIFTLLAGLVGPQVLKQLGGAKSRTALLQIRDLEQGLELYLLDMGHFPSTEQGLQALVREPPGVTGWHGPYLRSSTVPKDPWGNPYHYRHPGQHGAFDIYSLGFDGVPGGEGENADITSWGQP